MGKGDKKTKRGKIWKGTYGNSRKRYSPIQMPEKSTTKKAGK